jgi:response regulator of citrate/malate metabolism
VSYCAKSFQCIYVQRQQYNSQYFSIIPILPTDITAQSYHVLSALNDTDVVIVALNTTVLDITPVSGSSVSSTLTTYQAYYHQFGSDSDMSGTSVISDNKSHMYSFERGYCNFIAAIN